MHCRFASIFSHLTHFTDKDQLTINQASHVVSIHLILRSFPRATIKIFSISS